MKTPYVTGVLARPGALLQRVRLLTGTTVIAPTGDSDTHTLFDKETWQKFTGTTVMNNRQVFVSNGDHDANRRAVTGASYDAAKNQWLVHLSSSTHDLFRVNFMIALDPAPVSV